MRAALHRMCVHARVCKKRLLALPVSEGGVTMVGKKDFSLIQMLIFKSKWIYVLFLQLNRIIKKAHCFDHHPKGAVLTTMR